MNPPKGLPVTLPVYFKIDKVKVFLAHFSFAPERGSMGAGILLKHRIDVLLLNLPQRFLASERQRSAFPSHHLGVFSVASRKWRERGQIPLSLESLSLL